MTVAGSLSSGSPRREGTVGISAQAVRQATTQAASEARPEFTRSSLGGLTRCFPKRTDLYFDAIFNTPFELRIGTERDDERDGLYTQVVAGSIPAPPTKYAIPN